VGVAGGAGRRPGRDLADGKRVMPEMVKIASWRMGIFGVRFWRAPYVAIFAPWCWAISRIPEADYLNVPLGRGWRFVVRS
jgi:hypothetical protein